MKQIGNLFILRININLVGSILDSPEFFWSVVSEYIPSHKADKQDIPGSGAAVQCGEIVS